MQEYLNDTYYFDHGFKKFGEIVSQTLQLNQDSSDKEKAIAIYEYVRDNWRYNPYKISSKAEHYKASFLVQQTEGHCIDKSIILIALLRHVGIPSRLHLAKVKNHIAVERLTELFGTNELTPHGMVDVYLDGKWLKVSPAFNTELCEKYNVDNLDWDGEVDSVFHEYDKEGGLFMEYLQDYGSFEDVPLEFIFKNMKEHYHVEGMKLSEEGYLVINP